MADNNIFSNEKDTLNKIYKVLQEIQKKGGFGGGGGNFNIYRDIEQQILKDTSAIRDEHANFQEGIRQSEIKLINDEIERLNNVSEKYKNTLAWERKSKELETKLERLEHGGFSKSDINEHRDEIMKKYAGPLISGIKAGFDLYITHQQNELKKTKNAFDKQQKLKQAELQMSNVVASNLVTTISTSLTQTATQASRAITKGAMDEAHARIDLITSVSSIEQEFQIAESERKLEMLQKSTNAGAGVLNTVGSLIPGLGGIITRFIGAVGQGVIDIYSSFEQFDIEQSKVAKEFYDTMVDNMMKKPMDKIRKVVEGITDAANGIVDYARENETIYKKTGLAMGYSGDAYTKYMQTLQSKISETFNITAEQAAQMTNSYSDASGRMLMMTDRNFEQMEAVARGFGVSSSEVSSLMGEMNIFNTSISSGYDIMDKMYDTVTKIGLSTSKFSKELTNNLKLAQKYNFKGGVENMAKLTMWAEKTRFNIQNATSFAEKMMSNNISEVLETTAKLQVLGGNVGLFADPITMMWEAGNDVGALAKRQSAMFGDIRGVFNSRTGETEFTEFEFRKARAIADVMGINYEDILTQARESNKMGRVNKVLSGYGLSEEDKIGIGKRATWDKKSNKWVIGTMNGEMSISDFARLDSKERNKILLPDNEKDSLIETAKNTRSLVQIEEAMLAMDKAILAKQLWGTITNTSKKTSNKQREFNRDNAIQQAFYSSIEGQTNITIAQYDKMITAVKETPTLVENYYKYVENQLGMQTAISLHEVKLLEKLANKQGIKEITSNFGKLANAMANGDEDEINKLGKDPELKHFINSMGYGVGDGIGYTNGGFISNATVTPINDGIGSLIKTHSNDQFIAAKSGGPIDKLFDIVSSILDSKSNGNKSGKINIELSGNINLQDNSGNINLVEIIKKDPVTAREFIRLLTKNMDSANNGKLSQKHYI